MSEFHLFNLVINISQLFRNTIRCQEYPISAIIEKNGKENVARVYIPKYGEEDNLGLYTHRDETGKDILIHDFSTSAQPKQNVFNISNQIKLKPNTDYYFILKRKGKSSYSDAFVLKGNKWILAKSNYENSEEIPNEKKSERLKDLRKKMDKLFENRKNTSNLTTNSGSTGWIIWICGSILFVIFLALMVTICCRR